MLTMAIPPVIHPTQASARAMSFSDMPPDPISTPIVIKNGTERIDTGMRKVGAMLGDYVDLGCNSVANPGTVIGRNTNIYPLSPVRGFVPSDSIYKTGGVIASKE